MTGFLAGAPDGWMRLAGCGPIDMLLCCKKDFHHKGTKTEGLTKKKMILRGQPEYQRAAQAL